MTVKDLLTMSVGQEQDPAYSLMRGSEDWIRGFLYTEPVHTPGTVWMYNNFATFILSAIIQKVTGQMLFCYLQPRLFEPLEIENIEWDYNSQGITLGMIGSRLHTEDLAKFGQLALQKGKWGDKKIVSAAYIEEAGKFQIPTNNQNKPEEELKDREKGYGYQYWRGSHNSFRMDGMAGQLAIILPDYDAVVVLTSNVRNAQMEMDEIWTHLIPAMNDEALPENTELDEQLKQTLASLTWITDMETVPSDIQSAISGKQIKLDKNKMGIRNISFKFDSNNCNISIELENESVSIHAGLATWNYALTENASLISSGSGGFNYQRLSNEVNRDMRQLKKVAVACGMQGKDTLIFTARYIEENLGAETWKCHFTKENKQTVVEIITTAGGSRMPGGQPNVLRGKLNN